MREESMERAQYLREVSQMSGRITFGALSVQRYLKRGEDFLAVDKKAKNYGDKKPIYWTREAM
jgi:hypothetical protein